MTVDMDIDMALKNLSKAFDRVSQAKPGNLPFAVRMNVLLALIQLSFVPNSDKGRVAEVKKAFGENMRQLREAAGITQMEIAARSKFPQRQVSAVEIGEAHIALYPPMMLALEFCRVEKLGLEKSKEGKELSKWLDALTAI
jgi:DNA-binding transcriptional regulator YiaG